MCSLGFWHVLPKGSHVRDIEHIRQQGPFLTCAFPSLVLLLLQYRLPETLIWTGFNLVPSPPESRIWMNASWFHHRRNVVETLLLWDTKSRISLTRLGDTTWLIKLTDLWDKSENKNERRGAGFLSIASLPFQCFVRQLLLAAQGRLCFPWHPVVFQILFYAFLLFKKVLK